MKSCGRSDDYQVFDDILITRTSFYTFAVYLLPSQLDSVVFFSFESIRQERLLPKPGPNLRVNNECNYIMDAPLLQKWRL